jgi:subtilisin-like proprotein convertase family protein
MKKLLLFLAALPVLSAPAPAVTESFSFNTLNLAVPDGNPTGLANAQTFSSTITGITSMVLTLNVSGTFNGDLYVYLAHGTGFTVLLNRPGKTVANPFGYNDDGINVTFDDTAPGDIHTYRNTATPGVGTPLTGTWQPDGRNVDPNLVTDVSPRTSLLNSFNTGAASGEWTLFVADLSTGDTHTLQSWSLTITGSVPEPGAGFLAGMSLLVLSRRRRP